MPIFFQVQRKTPSSDPTAYLDGMLFDVTTKVKSVATLGGVDEAVRDLTRTYLRSVYPDALEVQTPPIGYWWWRDGDFYWCEKHITTVTIPDAKTANPIEVVITIDKHEPFHE